MNFKLVIRAVHTSKSKYTLKRIKPVLLRDKHSNRSNSCVKKGVSEIDK